MYGRRFSLQVKHTLLMAVIVCFAATVLSVYYYRAVTTRDIAELCDKGRALATNFAHNSETGVLLSDKQQLSLLVRLLAEDADVVAVEITTASGTMLVSNTSDPVYLSLSDETVADVLEENFDLAGIRRTEYRLKTGGERLFEFSVPVITRRIARGREEIGFMLSDELPPEGLGEQVHVGNVKVVFSSARTIHELRSIQENLFLITTVVALTGILITIPLVRLTVKPIRHLVEGTKRIAQGDLSKRVAVVTRDEIGELAQSFNQMAIDLQKKRDELKQHSRTLEERVRARTVELKRANEELELANAELRKAQAQLIQAGKMAAMGEFGAGVAHELNQPLTGIKGYTQLILSTIAEQDPIRAQLLEIDKQASRMKEITKTMWNLARQSKFEYSLLDIRQPIEDSLTLISEQFRQHQIEIETELERNLPRVYGDANQIHQVFLNFLTNAKDAIDDSQKGKVRIMVNTLAEDRYLQVVLLDNGRGIPADILDDIFNPFFTTKPPGKGTGLGLSINFSIIQQHHGFIDVHSEKSRGTAFSIALPTEKFVSCARQASDANGNPVAPCWVPRPGAVSHAHLRHADCNTCEVYLRFQSGPEMPLASEFKDFLSAQSGLLS